VLCRDGGVYVDTDLECLRPIDPLLDGVSLFLGALDSGRVSNAIIGSVPGHPLLMRALEELRPRSTYGPVDREGTGPLLLERLRAAWLRLRQLAVRRVPDKVRRVFRLPEPPGPAPLQ